jgi:hypothetical protein
MYETYDDNGVDDDDGDAHLDDDDDGDHDHTMVYHLVQLKCW